MTGLVLNINDRFIKRKVKFFNDFTFNLVYNSVGSTFGFSYYFDPNNRVHKEIATVSHYHEVTLDFNDQLLVTGVLTSQKFMAGPTKQQAQFSGYSLPGVLEDVNIPPRLYPLRSDGLSLEQIARKLIRPFKRNYGLTMTIDPAVQSKMNSVFDTSSASETSTIKDYLTELASQKDIVISHNEKGQLLFTEAKTDIKPILDFDLTKGAIPGTSFEMAFDGQGMHSHITMQKQASTDGGNAGEYTIRNPYVIGSVYRPKVMSQSSGTDNDTRDAAQKALANELRNMKLTIKTDRWLLDDGTIIKPNNVISIFAPELYIYRKVNFFIESINFTGNSRETIATLNCVLPEVYNGKHPDSIYKNINLHLLEP